MQFVQIDLHDIVFDKQSDLKGKVTFIDKNKKAAKIEVIIDKNEEKEERTTRLIKTKLYNLVLITKAPIKKRFDFDRQYNLVKKFHGTFGHPVAYKPTPLTLERAIDRTVWTAEEGVAEFLHASSNNNEEYLGAVAKFLERFNNAVEENLAKPYPKTDLERLVAQTDALTDESYLNNGSFVEMGIKPSRPFEIVQKSNMSKLDDDGKPMYHPDGKIKKSHNFFAPEEKLKEEIEFQIKESQK